MKLISLTFLGLHINSHLTWDTHIKEVSTKSMRTDGIIRKVQLILPNNIVLSRNIIALSRYADTSTNAIN